MDKQMLKEKMRARRKAFKAARGGIEYATTDQDAKVKQLLDLVSSLKAMPSMKEKLQIANTLQQMSQHQLDGAVESFICKFGVKSPQLDLLHTSIQRLKSPNEQASALSNFINAGSKTAVATQAQETEPTSMIVDANGNIRKRFR